MAIHTLMQHAHNLPSASCEIFIANLGGAVNRVAAEATAYPHRNTKFVLNVDTRWTDPSEDGKHIS